jgi:predicted nucleotidyltransferase
MLASQEVTDMPVSVEKIREVVNRIAPEYGVRSVSLFGSYVRGDADEASDIDLVVEMGRPLGFRRGRMCIEIESGLGKPVDVVFGREQLCPPVREQFDQSAVRIYAHR